MSAHLLASRHGFALVAMSLALQERGVPTIERRYFLSKVTQRPARWDEAWTEPGLEKIAAGTIAVVPDARCDVRHGR